MANTPLHPIRRPDPPFAAPLAQGLRLTAALAVLALAATPLVMNHAAYDDAYFGAKWAWIAHWGLIGLAAHLGGAVLRRTFRITLHPAPLMLAGLALLSLWSVTWAPSKSLAYEQAGRMAWIALAAFVSAPLVRGRRSLLWLGWIWIASSSVIATWVIWQDFARTFFPSLLHIKPNLPDWRGWISAGLGNTNHIGDLLALALIPSLMFFMLARRRGALRAAYAACILLAAGLTVCWSVGSNLGLISAALLMTGVILVREGPRFFVRRARRWGALGLGWGAMLLFFLVPHPVNPHPRGIWKEAFGSARWHEGGPTRLVIWGGALELIRKHPWQGVGAGNFTYEFPEAKSPVVAAHPELHVYQGMWTNAAHNILLEGWAELGILGFFLLVAMLVAALKDPLAGLRHCTRSESYVRLTIAALLLAWIVQGQMNFTLQHPTGALSLAMILLAVAAERFSRRTNIPVRVASLSGPFRVEIDFIAMKHPAWAGVRLEKTPAQAVAIAGLLLACALLTGIPLMRPLEAQRHYRLAREAVDPIDQEAHLLQAISLDPRATGARSYYSEWLVRNERPEEALDELKEVRRRLNSSELYDREARAYDQLDRPDKAERARARLAERHTPLGR